MNLLNSTDNIFRPMAIAASSHLSDVLTGKIENLQNL